jgi:hypothetical protein
MTKGLPDGVVPPLCINCELRPVNRAYGQYPPSIEFGSRVVGGKRWKWFCGKACQGQYRGIAARDSGQSTAASRLRAERTRQRLLARLVAACKGQMDAEQRVPVKAMVAALYKEIVRERNLMSCEGYHDRLRERRERMTA